MGKMKKILIATTNKDKFKIVSYILRRAGISEDLYEILSLNDINYDGPDIIEVGDILKRARVKAETIKNFFQNEIYDYFIGIDDGIILKGNMIGVFSSICLKNMTDLFFELSLKI